MDYLAMRVSDFTSWISTYGISTALIIVFVALLIIYLPKIWEEHQQNKKREHDQMDRLISMQSEQTKSVTAVAERSNVVIEANTRAMELNTRAYEAAQIASAKCMDALDDLSDKIEKNSDLNQKVYTTLLRVQDNIDDVKEKVS